jgi:hypothetical protein
MSFLLAKAAQEWGKTPEEFAELSQEDRLEMVAFTRANMKMGAWEADEQRREWERKHGQ